MPSDHPPVYVEPSDHVYTPAMCNVRGTEKAAKEEVQGVGKRGAETLSTR